jgi:hypothetical protein
MIYQPPADGIMKTMDLGDSKFYVVSCQCGNTDDDIRVNVEADDCGVSVHQWVTVTTTYWDTPTKFNWINGILHRIKMTYSLWIKGYLEYESYTILSSQQAFNYSHTLLHAVNDVKKFREENK